MNGKWEFLENVDSQIALLAEKPEFSSPPFPWQEFEKAIEKLFQLKELRIFHEEKGWGSFEPRDEVLTFYASNISTPFFWSMTKKDQLTLFQLLYKFQEEAAYFIENPLVQGLYQFTALSVLKEIDHLKFAEFLTFNLGEFPSKKLETNFYRVDISFHARDVKVGGSLYFSEVFRKEWKKHFAKYASFFLTPELQKKVSVEIGCEIGYCELQGDEIKTIKAGDFLVLDQCSYDVDKKEGIAVLTLNGGAIFRGKLKKEGIKILEYPHLDEARKTMQDENFEIEEPMIEEISKEKGALNLEKLPLQVVVEVGRLKMTLEEVSSLSTGSLIEMGVNVDDGVDLVVNGKKIGKGDLVKIGDKLGVRITKI